MAEANEAHPPSGLQRASDAASCPFRLAPGRVAPNLGLAGVAHWAGIACISALRSRLGQRQIRQQRGPCQYVNSLWRAASCFYLRGSSKGFFAPKVVACWKAAFLTITTGLLSGRATRLRRSCGRGRKLSRFALWRFRREPDPPSPNDGGTRNSNRGATKG